MPLAKPQGLPPLVLVPSMRATPVPVPAEAARQLDAVIPELHRVARSLTDDWAEADNLIQSVLLQLWSEQSEPDLAGGALRIRALELVRKRASALGTEPGNSRQVA